MFAVPNPKTVPAAETKQAPPDNREEYIARRIAEYDIPHSRKVLENGVTLISLEKEGTATRIASSMRAGMVFETEGEHGLAHFLEHVIASSFTGRHGFSLTDLAHHQSISCSPSTDWFGINFPGSSMDLDSDRLFSVTHELIQTSSLDAGIIESERSRIMDEIRREKGNPYNVRNAMICAVLCAGSSYAHHTLGTEETVQGFTMSDILSYRNKHFKNSNLTFGIVASGSIISMLEESILRQYPADPAPSAGNIPPPSQLNIQDAPLVTRSTEPVGKGVMMTIVMPSVDLTSWAERAPAHCLNSYLSLRLINELSFRDGLLYHGSVETLGMGNRTIRTVDLGFSSDKTERILDYVSKMIREVRDNGVPDDFVNSSRRSMINSYYQSMSEYNWAELLARNLQGAYQIDFRGPLSIIDDYMQITPELINRQCRKYLVPEQARFFLMGDQAESVSEKTLSLFSQS